MFQLMMAGGWLMLPIICCSILALGIILERLWTLQQDKIVPERLVTQTWHQLSNEKLDEAELVALSKRSLLGNIVYMGINHLPGSLATLQATLEEAGRRAVLHMERYVSVLGTIAAITPLLGLLGTVVGMIDVFTAITLQGVTDHSVLADGISKALITTAAGLIVAIPSLVGYRLLQRRIEVFTSALESEAKRFINLVQTSQ